MSLNISPRSQTQIRVLIVDDHIDYAETMAEALERNERYMAQYEPDPYSAVDQAKSFMPHVVLLDLMMEGMSGDDVFKAMKSDPILKSIPILVLSAKPKDELIKSRPSAFGSVNSAPRLEKPASLDELDRAIRRAIADARPSLREELSKQASKTAMMAS